MTDIVYFDYWTRGIRHFAAIDGFIKRRMLSTLLVHMGSKRGEPIIENQVLNGIRTIDISAYADDLIRMLELERPKVVVLLNYQTEDRIIIRACRSLKISTVFLMHGILTPSRYINQGVDLVNSAFTFRDRVKRGPKYIRLFFQYIKAASLGGYAKAFDFELVMYFVRQMYSPGGNLLGKWSYRDRADFALVYSAHDKELFISSYGYDSEQVLVVGNYNLDALHEKLDAVARVRMEGERGDKNVVYIENGFSDPKYTVKGWSEHLVAEELRVVSGVCAAFGYRLILKLHPSSDYSTLLDELESETNIEIIHRCDLADLIASADLVLGQTSSVLMMALAAGKPLGILSIPPLGLSNTMFVDEDFGILIKSEAELAALFSSLETTGSPLKSSSALQKNREFIGPFDGGATQRIADVILSLCACNA